MSKVTHIRAKQCDAFLSDFLKAMRMSLGRIDYFIEQLNNTGNKVSWMCLLKMKRGMVAEAVDYIDAEFSEKFVKVPYDNPIKSLQKALTEELICLNKYIIDFDSARMVQKYGQKLAMENEITKKFLDDAEKGGL